MTEAHTDGLHAWPTALGLPEDCLPINCLTCLSSEHPGCRIVAPRVPGGNTTLPALSPGFHTPRASAERNFSVKKLIMELKDMMSSEISQEQKGKHCMNSVKDVRCLLC